MIFLYSHYSLVISYHSVWLGLELFGLVHVQVHTLRPGVSRSRAEDVTITNVIIKTPDRNRTGVRMTSCQEFLVILKKAVRTMGEAS